MRETGSALATICDMVSYETDHVLRMFCFRSILISMEYDNPINADIRRGRAAASNTTDRYARVARVPFDDGWGLDEDLQILRTHVSDELARSIITRNTSPDISFDRSINPYRGCEHGCIYCYARPTHAYLGLSPGLDFETQLIARPNAAQVLERELSKPNYRPATIAIGTNTDAYQPIEKTRGIMREILQVLDCFNHPVGIVTKGSLIERDIDILGDMAARGLARVGISVTTLDPKVSRKMEPRVPAPARRLQTIRRLSDAGIPVRLMASPVIPALTDHELEAIIAAGAKAGAQAASAILLRLPQEVSGLFSDWLHEHFPDRAARVLGRVRDLHGGQLYDAQWRTRFKGTGPWADLIRKRVEIARNRHGLARELPDLRCDLFEVPPKAGDQMSLF